MAEKAEKAKKAEKGSNEGSKEVSQSRIDKMAADAQKDREKYDEQVKQDQLKEDLKKELVKLEDGELEEPLRELETKLVGQLDLNKLMKELVNDVLLYWNKVQIEHRRLTLKLISSIK